MDIGTKIRKLREGKKLSQNELALELGISQTTLHNIEIGASQKINFLLMDKISRIFDKDLDYFLENSSINNSVQENKGQINFGENVTIHNSYPEHLLDELKKLLAEKDEQIALLKNALEKK